MKTNSKPCRKSKPQKSRSRTQQTSIVPIDVLPEGWIMYPRSLQEYIQLLPLVDLAEVLGLEVSMRYRVSEASTSSSKKRGHHRPLK